jgi:flagellar capping protein FliD
LDSKLQIIDETGSPSNALNFLGLNGDLATGQNSKVTVTTDFGDKLLENQGNTFSMDGITYNLHNTGTTNLGSKVDTQQSVDKIKDFVNEYNKIMDKVNNLLKEKKSYDYKPLTEDQKKDMSEEEIKLWESKAKQGILRGDKDLYYFIEDMRKAIFDPIGGVGSSLHELGITIPKDYNKKGQIYIDESKLKKSLEERGDVLFNALTNISTSTDATQKYNETGALQRLKDVVNKYSGGSASILIKKAGLQNSVTEYTSVFAEQMRKKDDLIKELELKLSRKEDKLYSDFAKLEAAMNEANSQSSWFAQQMA